MKRAVEAVRVVRCPLVSTTVRVQDEHRTQLSCANCQYFLGWSNSPGHIECDFMAEHEKPQLRRWVVYATQREYLSFHVDALTPEDAKELVLSGEVDPYETIDSDIGDIVVETTESDSG